MFEPRPPEKFASAHSTGGNQLLLGDGALPIETKDDYPALRASLERQLLDMSEEGNPRQLSLDGA